MTSELVAQQVAALRNILRDHPDAIRLADPELQFLSWLADKFAMDYVAEAKRLIAEIGGQEAKSEDNSWRLPNQ